MDVSNAFNAISRNAIECQLEQKAPSLLGYFRSCYKNPSHLLAAARGTSTWLSSNTGVLQGDLLGPALFCIGYSIVLQFVRDMHPGVGVQAYQDDVYLVGTDAEVAAAIDTFKGKCQNVQLRVNTFKSHVLAPHSSISVHSTYNTRGQEANAGHVVLGSLVRTSTFVNEFLIGKAMELQTALQRLKDVLGNERHAAYNLLTYCVGRKLSHLVRTTPPSLLQDFATKNDRQLRKFLKYVFDLPLTHWRSIQQQIHLPVRLGGLGVPSIDNALTPAYYASWAQAGNAVGDFLHSFTTTMSLTTSLDTELACCVDAACSLASPEKLQFLTSNDVLACAVRDVQQKLMSNLYKH